EWQAGWLLRAITLMDLTTLSGDDTPGNVRRLCAKARHPLRDDITKALGVEDKGITVGAVCVYHAMVPTAVDALAGTNIPVAAVSTGFPAGLSPLEERVSEIRASVAAGAREIDIVITRAHVLTGNYAALYDGVRHRLQARRRHPLGQDGARVPLSDEGGARRPLAPRGPVPLRRQRAAHR